MRVKKMLLFCLFVFVIASNAFADASRFIVSEPVAGDKIVTDSVTNLIWQKSYAEHLTWEEALSNCENANYAGQTDWRLPNKIELMTLVNYAIFNPSSDFPDMPIHGFWSSSSNCTGFTYAWTVSFKIGYVIPRNKTSPSYRFARCVRN